MKPVEIKGIIPPIITPMNEDESVNEAELRNQVNRQIEGGVLMGLGYALTEDFPLKDCVPTARFGTLGLLRADQIPDIHAIYVEKEELLPFAYGAKGIGEIATIPTAPAVQGAYYAMDHVLRATLPMEDTYYRKPKKG